MRTLRTRLLISTGVGTTLVMLVAGVFLHGLIADALRAEFDATLAVKARSLAAMMEQENDELELEFDRERLPEYANAERGQFYQIWIGDGEVFARSQSLGQQHLPFIADAGEEPAYRDLELPGGPSGRLVCVRFAPRAENEEARANPLAVTLAVAASADALAATLGLIRSAMIAVGVAAVLVALLVLAWSVRRGLQPVDDLAGDIARMDASDLGTRVEPAGMPGELQPVVERLNDLLERLDEAFRRERQFTADVAHELRTPLSGLRSTLEVALSRPRDPDDYREAMSTCLGVNRQMQQMVENLLALARADASRLEIHPEALKLADLVRDTWQAMNGNASRDGVEIVWQLDDPCETDTDPTLARLIVQNLLANAAAYTNDGGRITLSTSTQGGAPTLRIANTGCSLSPEQVEHVFDRFWRGDPSRQGNGQHCGLGLSLCKTLIERLGGTIKAEVTPDREFVATVRLA